MNNQPWTFNADRQTMKNELKIKICGITNLDDALAAARFGADYLGFVLTKSRRRITPEDAGRIAANLPETVTPVAVFRDEKEEEVVRATEIAGIRTVQIHGEKDPELAAVLAGRFRVIRRIPVRSGDDAASLVRRLDNCGAAIPLLDPGAGDGAAFDWTRFQGLNRPFWLAGGLTPDNVQRAVSVLNPRAVDVSTGVERAPGLKDADKMKRFISEAR
jgi:phosphoribosylanthranilate isomerase